MKKIPKLQIFRTIIQIVFLILLPGLFTMTFTEIGKIYTMLIKGNFNIVQVLPKMIEILTIVPITIILGRFFCGWMCAFGTVGDLIYKIFNITSKTKFRISEKIDDRLKYLKYIVLGFIIVAMWTFESKLFNTASPWNAFASIGQFPQSIYSYAVGFIILAFIFAGSIFVERFFCRYLCPLGAIFSLISNVRIFKLDKPNEKCGKCRICTNNCAMGLKLYKVNKVSSGECINCMKCVDACPRKNIEGSLLNVNMNPALVGSAAVAGILGVYSISGAVNASVKSSSVVTTGSTVISAYGASSNTTSTTTTETQYKDGTYTGTGVGFRPGLQVSVSIKSNKITNIEITAINDTPRFYEEPVNTVPEAIIKSQSTKVDGVSGATRTSDGIKSAVDNALSKAKL